MKRTIRLSALLGMVFLLGACTEDDIINNYGPKDCVGDEIVFGISSGTDGKTRTVYGDHSAEDKAVEVNWIAEDMLMIACPQAAGTQLAHYQVTAETEVNENKGTIDGYSETSIERAAGETVSLQWGTGDGENGTHDFYGVYPSFKKSGMASAENGDNPYVKMNDDGFVGYLPLDQSVPASSVTTDAGGNIIVNPNMDIAYMVAHTPGVVRGSAVELQFNSLNTVLQFQIYGCDFEGVANDEVKIHGASLISANGNALCGSFNYKFADNSCKFTGENPSTYSNVTIALPEPKVVTTETYCDLTFFILPTYGANEADDLTNDLQLQVMYSIGNKPQVKKATLKSESITPKKKHLFKNVKLPKVSQEITGSNWFSALDNNVLLSQVSIPVAGNAFTSYYNDNNADAKYIKEQYKSYIELWNMGIRGFEFRTSYVYDTDNNLTVKGAQFVANGDIITATDEDGTNLTFDTAFEKLAKFATEDNTQECLVIIATYQSYDDTKDEKYSPANYIAALRNYLGESAYNDKFVMINSQSTVESIRGKIAIIVRPGDGHINNETMAYDLSDLNVSVINNWGTSVDQWDKRYKDKGYKTEGAYTGGTTAIEENMWGIAKSNSTTSFSAYTYDGTTYKINGISETLNPNYTFNLNSNTGGAHVQSWTRIIPSTFKNGAPFNTGIYNETLLAGTYYLWLHWKESLSDKKAMIDSTLTASINSRDKRDGTLYINSLCGFFPEDGYPSSWYPQLAISYKQVGRISHVSFTMSNAAAGGDWLGCSAELNSHVCDKLEKATVIGPLGLVIINHIGATKKQFEQSSYIPDGTAAEEASVNLPSLIMMNNFKFPLAKKTAETTPATEMRLTNDPVDPAAAVYVNWRR